MKVIALLLLVSCAPAATAIPSSLPYVHIDPELTGAVISREGAIAVAGHRIEDKAKCDTMIADREARIQSAEQALVEQTKRADKSAWWDTWGPGLVAGTSSAAIVAIAVLLSVVFQR